MQTRLDFLATLLCRTGKHVQREQAAFRQTRRASRSSCMPQSGACRATARAAPSLLCSRVPIGCMVG
eukprot:59272-Chlamydomonas_euryale.AAC.2